MSIVLSPRGPSRTSEPAAAPRLPGRYGDHDQLRCNNVTSTGWVPLSCRRAGAARPPLVEGVPTYMVKPLQDWLRRVLNAGGAFDDLYRDVRLHLRTDDDLWNATGEKLLDVVDAALYWYSQYNPHHEYELAADVEIMLRAGGSAWRVARSGDQLERRVDDTVIEAARTAAKSAKQEASEHLAAAWAAAYSRDPDPDKAYREAVLAVEAVACPLVAPNDPKPTLGKVNGNLRDQAGTWELSITDGTGQPAGIDRLRAMLELLWDGQSRHAGGSNSRRQTKAEGEAAVHLAATLVQWLSTGVLRRK